MNQVAGGGMLVAQHRLGGLQVAQARQPSTGQHPAHGAFGQAQAGGDTTLGEPAPTQLDNGHGPARRDRLGAAARARRAVGQPRRAVSQITRQPLAGGGRADPRLGCRLSGGQPALGYRFDHFHSTNKGQSGILMGVHSAGLLKDADWVAPSSLSDSVRMNSNNLLEHHS